MEETDEEEEEEEEEEEPSSWVGPFFFGLALAPVVDLLERTTSAEPAGVCVLCSSIGSSFTVALLLLLIMILSIPSTEVVSFFFSQPGKERFFRPSSARNHTRYRRLLTDLLFSHREIHKIP